jgi:DNA-binding transcriptional ArsR family regulator
MQAPEARGATVTWSVDKNLTSNYTVAVGDTLIIEPGVTVSLDPGISIFVEGTLNAVGTGSQPIIFSPITPGLNWGSIMFNSTSINSILNYAVFDNATTGLFINSSNPTISHTTITSSSLYGIHINESSPTIENSTIFASGALDIYVESLVGALPITLNTSFDKSSVNVVGAGSSLKVQWYLDVAAMDTFEDPIQDAEILVKNSSQELVYDGFSDSQGLASWIVCTEFINYTGSRIYETPYNITVSKEDYDTGYASPEPIIDSSIKIPVIIKDNLPPATTVIIGSPNISGNPVLVASSTNFTFTVVETGSGVAIIEYRIDDDNWIEYLTPFNITSLNQHNITYRSIDKVGNEEIEKVLWIYVNSPPSIELSAIPDATANSLFQYRINATDIDEMDAIIFTLDSGPEGMFINATTGSISWQPEDEHVGTIRFIVNITDGLSYVVREFTIIVNAPIPTNNPLMENLWLISITTTVIAVFGALGATEYGRYGIIKFLFLPLYSKLKKEKLLNQFTRGKIYGYILANQGEHYNSIKNALDLSNGSLTYHLSVLEREDMIKSRIDGRYKRFYPKGAPTSSHDGSDLMSMPQRYMYEIVKRTPGITQIEIAEIMGESKQVINYHIKLLENRGLLDIHYEGKYTHCFIKK